MKNKTEEKLNKKIRNKLIKAGLGFLEGDVQDGVVFLKGETPSIAERVAAGYTGASLVKKYGLRGTVCDIQVQGMEEPGPRLPAVRDEILEGRYFDAVIIGGGIIGVTAARELARRDISVLLLEKEEDLGLQATGRNDGMIHPGMAASPGSLKAKYNVPGNKLYTRAAEELGFELQRPGSLLLYRNRLMRLVTPVLKARCRKNGVKGGRPMSRREIAEAEPVMTENQYGGFFMPSAGIVSPREVVLAYGENAAANGVEFFFHTAVTGMRRRGKKIEELQTNRGCLQSGVVINAAGVWSDHIAEMAGDRFFSIHPRKGVDAILDKRCGSFVRRICGMPSLLGTGRSHSKGGGIVPCVEGNVLLGPTAKEVLDREDYSTERADIEELKKHLDLNTRLSMGDIITYYAGIRAATWEEDFIIGRSETVENLIHGAGIQSPGLASAPAIAEELSRLAVECLEIGGRKIGTKNDFKPCRTPPPRPAQMSAEEREALITRDPAYGRIVCRCEEVSEGEIRDAVTGLLPAVSVDGVKRRTRAGGGRCHGGFCQTRVMEILAREQECSLETILKKGEGSWIVEDKEGHCDA